MRLATTAAILATAFLAAACQSGTTVPSDGPPRIEYGILPSAGSTPSEEDTELAADVFAARLEALGFGPIGTAVATDAITLGLAATADDGLVRSVISTTGEVAFVPLGSSDAIPAVEGQPLPESVPPLFEADQIASASVETDPNTGSGVLITLEDEGARLFAEYTSKHVGDWFAIVLDGRVLALPVVTGPMTDGAMVLSIPEQDQTIPSEALAAILNGGPIPEPWRNPRISR